MRQIALVIFVVTLRLGAALVRRRVEVFRDISLIVAVVIAAAAVVVRGGVCAAAV